MDPFTKLELFSLSHELLKDAAWEDRIEDAEQVVSKVYPKESEADKVALKITSLLQLKDGILAVFESRSQPGFRVVIDDITAITKSIDKYESNALHALLNKELVLTQELVDLQYHGDLLAQVLNDSNHRKYQYIKEILPFIEVSKRVDFEVEVIDLSLQIKMLNKYTLKKSDHTVTFEEMEAIRKVFK